MISYLVGKIVSKQSGSVTVLTSSGLGYKVNLAGSFSFELAEGQELELHTYLKVSETAMDLYGFKTLEEKQFFQVLISVKGVGPKGALNILNLGSIDEIKSAVSRGDVVYLTQVSGIGRRTAERMVVELKSKLKTKGSKPGEVSVVGDVLGEVIDGLVALGYTKEEARSVAQGLDATGKTTEELLRMALRGISK